MPWQTKGQPYPGAAGTVLPLSEGRGVLHCSALCGFTSSSGCRFGCQQYEDIKLLEHPEEGCKDSEESGGPGI